MPTLTEEQWDGILRRTGFSGTDNSISGQLDTARCSPRVVLSTAVSAGNADYPNVSIVLGASNPSGIFLDSVQVSLKDLTGSNPTTTTLNQASIDGMCCVVLDINEPLLANITEEQFASLQSMCSRAEGILWVTRGAFHDSTVPDANMVLGLARTIRSENTTLKFVTLDLDTQEARSDMETAETIVRMFKTAFGSNFQAYSEDVEFSERNGIISIPRLVPDAEKDNFIMHETQPPVPESQPYVQSDRHLRLTMKTPGLLDSLYFIEDTRLADPIGETMLDIDVKAVGMNFKDVMIGLGQIPYQDLGIECSGVVTALGKTVSGFAVGDRVCTMAGGCYANRIRVPDFTVQKIPDDMTFTTAASILTIFATAHYSLFNVAHLQQGESVLIHAAAGGVGQAATMLAQMIGAEIFITVGSTEKKNFMMNTYHVPEDHIFSSRDTTFERGIMTRTKGEGVDVILNSVASEALRLTWNCLAPLGRFIEVGKRDMVQNNRLEMRKFLTMATFASVDLAVVIQKRPEVFHKTCADVMELLRIGAVKPVSPITVYPISKIESALRLMQTGKHMGKIVVEAQPGDHVQVRKVVSVLDVTNHFIGNACQSQHLCYTCECIIPNYGRHRRTRTIHSKMARQARRKKHHLVIAQWYVPTKRGRTDRRHGKTRSQGLCPQMRRCRQRPARGCHQRKRQNHATHRRRHPWCNGPTCELLSFCIFSTRLILTSSRTPSSNSPPMPTTTPSPIPKFAEPGIYTTSSPNSPSPSSFFSLPFPASPARVAKPHTQPPAPSSTPSPPTAPRKGSPPQASTSASSPT